MSAASFAGRVDFLHRVARAIMCQTGTIAEAVVLVRGDGHERAVVNLTGVPFRHRQHQIAAAIHRFRAVAAIHILDASLTYAATGTREHVLVTDGQWPAAGLGCPRLAVVIASAAGTDLADLPVPAGGITSSSWITPLLPGRRHGAPMTPPGRKRARPKARR